MQHSPGPVPCQGVSILVSARELWTQGYENISNSDVVQWKQSPLYQGNKLHSSLAIMMLSSGSKVLYIKDDFNGSSPYTRKTFAALRLFLQVDLTTRYCV
ncbi:hypothetical protein RRG08_009923 [Elysia crispata]|uniref:Uncharacterized protein n=1 Tax=Elysia crispata TaxID=231223 RepID=A0AAE1ARB7_9GAST|nr:hypothetical protein RRG08_009923 [Elysia crispata]